MGLMEKLPDIAGSTHLLCVEQLTGEEMGRWDGVLVAGDVNPTNLIPNPRLLKPNPDTIHGNARGIDDVTNRSDVLPD